MSGPDWREPRRACLPFARWPAADRDGWLAATRKGDLLLDDGPGATLKSLTLSRHCRSYGRRLGFLERAGMLDPSALSGARASREAIEAYIIDLEDLNAPQTVVVRMQSLSSSCAGLPRRSTGPGCAAVSFGSKPGQNRCGTSAHASSSPTRSSPSASSSPQRPRATCPPRGGGPSSIATGS